MKLAMIGLGKMGANMTRRLRRGALEVVGYDRSAETVQALAAETGMAPAASLEDLVAQLPTPRVIWLMVPSGAPTQATIETLTPLLAPGDLIVDGGNSNYRETLQRGAQLAEHRLGFVDAGTSGGVWGLDNGYCLMVGGADSDIERLAPALKVLAPAADRGWAHVGPVGAGHYTKMVHNGIEYGMMQAFAEGFALLRAKEEFALDLAQIAELWRHSSVVRSWLLDLTAGFLQDDQALQDVAPVVADSGEGRWTVLDSVDEGVATPVLALALYMRFSSQDQEGYANRMLAMMRKAFGGHAVQSKD